MLLQLHYTIMAEKLLPWAEAVGNVRSVKEEGDIAILTLEGVGDISLDKDKSLMSKLRKARGRRIGILRTDIPGHEYILRKFTRG